MDRRAGASGCEAERKWTAARAAGFSPPTLRGAEQGARRGKRSRNSLFPKRPLQRRKFPPRSPSAVTPSTIRSNLGRAKMSQVAKNQPHYSRRVANSPQMRNCRGRSPSPAPSTLFKGATHGPPNQRCMPVFVSNSSTRTKRSAACAQPPERSANPRKLVASSILTMRGGNECTSLRARRLLIGEPPASKSRMSGPRQEIGLARG